jgi:hypothetical protein
LPRPAMHLEYLWGLLAVGWDLLREVDGSRGSSVVISAARRAGEEGSRHDLILCAVAAYGKCSSFTVCFLSCSELLRDYIVIVLYLRLAAMRWSWSLVVICSCDLVAGSRVGSRLSSACSRVSASRSSVQLEAAIA